MTDEQFWQIVENARGHGGDVEHAERLEGQLDQLSAAQIVAFAVMYDSRLRLADCGAVWAAGVLLNGGHGSDDGFLYFRHWLIGQGRSVYSAALSNPDSLASRTVMMVEGRPSAEWEIFGAAADTVYQDKTQRDLYTDKDAHGLQSTAAPEEWDWSQYQDAYMRKHLPKLWSRYGHHKIEFDRRVEALVQESQEQAARTEVEIAGLGVVKAGVVIIHRHLGKGTILGVEPYPDPSEVLSTIKFDDGVDHIVIDAETRDWISFPR